MGVAFCKLAGDEVMQFYEILFPPPVWRHLNRFPQLWSLSHSEMVVMILRPVSGHETGRNGVDTHCECPHRCVQFRARKPGAKSGPDPGAKAGS